MVRSGPIPEKKTAYCLPIDIKLQSLCTLNMETTNKVKMTHHFLFEAKFHPNTNVEYIIRYVKVTVTYDLTS